MAYSLRMQAMIITLCNTLCGVYYFVISEWKQLSASGLLGFFIARDNLIQAILENPYSLQTHNASSIINIFSMHVDLPNTAGLNIRYFDQTPHLMILLYNEKHTLNIKYGKTVNLLLGAVVVLQHQITRECLNLKCCKLIKQIKNQVS